MIYDCLFPNTVGGAERWYRNLAERLAADGHEVTYLTMRQWDRGDKPAVPSVRVQAVGPRMALYTDSGRRRIIQALVFGAGVFWHLLRHGRRYDVVHTASFPYFSLLAAALMRPLGGFELVVDWHEVWSREYWREYLGVLGPVGVAVQRRCVRVRQRAFCFSRLHAARLREEGLRGEVEILEGEYAGSLRRPPSPRRRSPACTPSCSATDRSGSRCWRGSLRSPIRGSRQRPASWRRRRSTTRCGARPPWCCRHDARATA
jgi:glycosyltransferase involved in cell wall biosynthesis